MPKLKTHKGAAKRFKKTASGGVKRAHAMKNHILTKKSTKRKRKLRRAAMVPGKFARSLRTMLG